MRLNKFLALATGMGRRPADAAIAAGRVQVNGAPAQVGQDITETDVIAFDGKALSVAESQPITIMLNKPVGYIVSRDGQGGKTVYDLLPPEYQALKPIGRLDKNSSGLLLLTNDGRLANELTHPSRQKVKVYEIELGKPLQPLHRQIITDHGVLLDDGPSTFQLERLRDNDDKHWTVTMHEGRNRQIRRTFKALGYTVTALRRTHFGPYRLGNLPAGQIRVVSASREPE